MTRTLTSTALRRTVPVLAVVALFALAGCGTGGDDLNGNNTTTALGDVTTTIDGTGTTPADGETTTADGETTTADGETTTADGETTTADGQTTTADGETTTVDDQTTTTAGDGGDLPADAAQQHAEALRDAGSFTVDTATTFSNQTEALFTTHSVAMLDLEAEVGSLNTSQTLQGGASNLSIARYTEGDTTYQRTASFGTVTYQVDSIPYDGAVQPVNFTTVVGNATATNVSEVDVSFDEAGTETLDGETVTRYTANDSDLAALFESQQLENATIDRGNMTLWVGEDGVFRQWTLSLTVETDEDEQVTVDVRQSVTDVGDTTVEEPPWLEEAMDQAATTTTTDESA